MKFVIFGATGDLTKRKLIPAFYNLIKNNSIKEIEIICIARKELSKEEYINYLKIEYNKLFKKSDEDIWSKLIKNINYIKADFLDLKNLKLNIRNDNVIYYLATMPENYKPIIEYLRKNKLNNKLKKIVIEKPFGYNLNDAKKINKILNKAFREEQIFRIDHYLAKEAIQNLLTFRFMNSIFESLWNKNYIDNIQITIAEDQNVADRINYYDKSGAIRDMVQNHILQIISLITMKCPRIINYKSIEENKIKALNDLKISKYLLGQYENYEKKSDTETYAAIKFYSNNKNFKNIPIYIRTGKNLNKKISLIYIEFKNNLKNLKPNALLIKMYPNNDIDLFFNQKKPGLIFDTERVKLDFCYESLYGYNTMEAYEELILLILKNEKSLFTSWKFIEKAWKIVDPLISKKNRIYYYKNGSYGPKEAEELLKNDNREWYKY